MSPFPSIYEEYIFKSRYARWIDAENRRENWDETVTRLRDYYWYRMDGKVDAFDDAYTEIWDAIYNLEVLPSMRSLMTAGPAMEKNDICAYNCAYLPVDSLRSFDETMIILLHGTGVGYSVERKYIDQLPRISEHFDRTDTVIRVSDSKEGWAKSLRELLALLVAGQIPGWDVSRVRPAGSRLRTFGGRASGPEPLVDLFEFCIAVFTGAAGRRLTSLECHDILCKIGDVVVVGGVRRSAMISLFDATDDLMTMSKSGQWYDEPGIKRHGYRSLANNSAVYSRKPDPSFFMKKWKELYDSHSGEPGLFSRIACQRIAARNGRRDPAFEFGTNPCSEIILRPYQFCNLTEIVVRPGDTFQSLVRKARVAAILGTIQSAFTDFKYLRRKWKETCDEERLLGVSLTGVCDNLGVVLEPGLLDALKKVVIETNVEWAARLGIAESTATTCVKPSGTVSQLVHSSSGLHARHSPYYIRTVRADVKDPVTYFLKDAGVYWESAIGKEDSTVVFYFAQKSPEGSVTRHDQGAIAALTLWEKLQDEWCEHKPSATINIKDDEWMDVAAWVYSHFDKLSGVSFLPYDGGVYQQAPYQEVTKEEYDKWIEQHPLPKIDWSDLRHYETEDGTTGSQEFACVSGQCEL